MYEKLPKVNNHPMSEKLPNLVTLAIAFLLRPMPLSEIKSKAGPKWSNYLATLINANQYWLIFFVENNFDRIFQYYFGRIFKDYFGRIF
jgi:hypothetical protein